VVSGNEGELYLDEMGEHLGGPDNGTGRGHRREVNEREELLALKSHVVGLSRTVHEMRTMQEQHRLEIRLRTKGCLHSFQCDWRGT
jgi:hypothetical protein